ncbi:hypothetical protein D3H55_00615 [Bacillus salacetis]|uniref:Uncharacterized protein n=1 Tax=Bacillus salacetis TaxID=2315464 RepID=A0A3A1RBU7_9BACI|nr:hypothetical protein D3H55_00615 [Bacillus salacetis]
MWSFDETIYAETASFNALLLHISREIFFFIFPVFQIDTITQSPSEVVEEFQEDFYPRGGNSIQETWLRG